MLNARSIRILSHLLSECYIQNFAATISSPKQRVFPLGDDPVGHLVNGHRLRGKRGLHLDAAHVADVAAFFLDVTQDDGNQVVLLAIEPDGAPVGARSPFSRIRS